MIRFEVFGDICVVDYEGWAQSTGQVKSVNGGDEALVRKDAEGKTSDTG